MIFIVDGLLIENRFSSANIKFYWIFRIDLKNGHKDTKTQRKPLVNLTFVSWCLRGDNKRRTKKQ